MMAANGGPHSSSTGLFTKPYPHIQYGIHCV